MNSNRLNVALLTLLVALSACRVASHTPARADQSPDLAAYATPPAQSWPEPMAPFEPTVITPAESAGAARAE